MKCKKRTLFAFTLLSLIALVVTLLLALPQMRAGAQDCYDCHGGGDPPPPSGTEPAEPPDPPGPPDPTAQPPDPTEPPEPTEPPCDPYYDPPTISASLALNPPYPITLGQDPEDTGVDVSGITARGGMHHCPNSGRASITSFAVLRVQLAQSSIAWITGELALKYPGAHVKGMYPFTPSYQVSGLGTPTAQISFHLAPLDPGYYEVTVAAAQSDGQSVTATLRVPVYLMESTIIQ